MLHKAPGQSGLHHPAETHTPLHTQLLGEHARRGQDLSGSLLRTVGQRLLGSILLLSWPWSLLEKPHDADEAGTRSLTRPVPVWLCLLHGALVSVTLKSDKSWTARRDRLLPRRPDTTRTAILSPPPPSPLPPPPRLPGLVPPVGGLPRAESKRKAKVAHSFQLGTLTWGHQPPLRRSAPLPPTVNFPVGVGRQGAGRSETFLLSPCEIRSRSDRISLHLHHAGHHPPLAVPCSSYSTLSRP